MNKCRQHVHLIWQMKTNSLNHKIKSPSNVQSIQYTHSIIVIDIFYHTYHQINYVYFAVADFIGTMCDLFYTLCYKGGLMYSVREHCHTAMVQCKHDQEFPSTPDCLHDQSPK